MSPPNVRFAVDDFGVLTGMLFEIFGDRIVRKSEIAASQELVTIDLIGMNPRCVSLTAPLLADFKKEVCGRLSIDTSGPCTKALLVERVAPADFYVNEASIRSGGSLRRSIRNHEQLAAQVRSSISDRCTFQNVQLEKMPLREQIGCFDQAALVIAQHGAALANCVWMRPGAVVVELGHDLRHNHFATLCRYKGVRHFLYRTDSDHATIDTAEFEAWIRKRLREHEQQLLRA
jgi:hypothetical protein